jgi:hypothetical protein
MSALSGERHSMGSLPEQLEGSLSFESAAQPERRAAPTPAAVASAAMAPLAQLMRPAFDPLPQ